MKLVSLTCILASLVALATSSRIIVKEPPSRAPSTDCSTIIYDMMDCVSFLNDGSKVQKPSSSCCSGLKSVLTADPDCVCVAIKSSGDMGIELNLTRAAALAAACGVSAPPLSHCHISVPPDAAPGTAPSHSPAEPPSESPDIPPSTAPQHAAKAPSPADAPSNDAVDAPAPAKAGAAHSVPAIPVVLISLLLLTLDIGFSFMA